MERVSEWTGRTSEAIITALRQRVRKAAERRHDRVDERASHQWIAWRSRKADRVFAEIRPLRGRIQVFILPGPGELSDASGLAQRAPRTQGWGWFLSWFEVSSLAQVDAAARLIVQSYERGARKANGGRTAPKRPRAQGL